MKSCVSHDPAKHVQDDGSLGVSVGVEIVVGVPPLFVNDGPHVPIVSLTEICQLFVQQVDGPFVLSEVVFAEEVLAVRREALADPCLTPRPVGNEVAPPHVSRFVGDQGVGREVLFGPFVMDRRLS